MKRFLISTIILILLFPIPSSASEYSDYLDSFDLTSFELLDDETEDLLEELGINDFDYEKITDISFNDVINIIVNIFAKKAETPLKSGISVIAFIILSSILRSFGNQLNRNTTQQFYDTVTNLIISVYLVTALSDCIALCCSTVKLCADFSYAFFPAFCIIIAASGSTAASISVNTTLLTLAQGLNVISSNFFMPAVQCFLALGICSSLRKELNLGGITSAVKSVITTLISTLSAVFVSILSLKTAVASKADALGLRSVRFAINSIVPVIGNSISEGLLSIQSYSSLIKTSVGVVGIIAVATIFLPAVIEASIWRFILLLADTCSKLFFDGSASDTVCVFRDTLMIINVILILSMVTTVISIGILIAAKTVN